MGADLLLVAVPVDIDKDDARQRLDTTPDDVIVAWAKEHWDAFYDCDYEAVEDLDSDDPFDPAIFRRILCRAIDNVYAESRCTVPMTFDGRRYRLNGGTSWGDSPSDEFDEFCLLAEIPLTWNEPQGG